MGKQWKQGQTLFFWAPKSLQMVTAAMKLKDVYSLEGKLWPTVRGHSTLRDPICSSLWAVSQGLSIPYQFLGNRNEQSCMQFSGLKSWEGAPAWIPFSDSLQWLPSVTLLKCNLFSYAPLTQDMECFLAPWRLLFAWLCFLLPKAALYEDI